jgi:pyruvate dehydrogenase E2 component (dihydrolipoamide acetyltransferase)
MATNVLLPQWGMNMEDGLLVKWLVKEGDTVEAGQPLVEVETAKINSELEAPVSGVIAHIVAESGTTVDVGTVLAVIVEPGESVPRPESGKPKPTFAVGATPRRSAPGGAVAGGGRQVTPVARRLARESDIDLAEVEGTGSGGRVTEEDVRRAVEAREPAGPVPAGQVVVLGGLRKTIADRMVQSVRSMAQVTLTTEADVTEMVRLRESLVSAWRPQRIRPLDQDLILWATGRALKEHPRLNATLDGDEMRLLDEINIGVATPVAEGLVVTVVRRADEKELLGIAKDSRELAKRARDGALTVDDVTGASFTVTSLAGYDIDAFTPIIDPPQVAILGVGRVVERPAAHEGHVALRSMMHLSLTFDHRALDGVPAAEFLRTLKRMLERAEEMVGGGK